MGVERLSDLEGAVHLVLPKNVSLLDPEEAIFEAKLVGWCRQQTSRQLKKATIDQRLRTRRAFQICSDRFPWSYTATDCEEYTAEAASARNSIATIRGKQNSIHLFMEVVVDRRYALVR